MDGVIKKIEKQITLYKKKQNNSDYNSSIAYQNIINGLNEAKKLIESEQKEPCEWCNKDYRFEFNWIDKNGDTVTTKDHLVIGGEAEYCPVCGRKLGE